MLIQWLSKHFMQGLIQNTRSVFFLCLLEPNSLLSSPEDAEDCITRLSTFLLKDGTVDMSPLNKSYSVSESLKQIM